VSGKSQWRGRRAAANTGAVMHEGQVAVSADALAAAVASQFPDLGKQTVRSVRSAGTVIAPFRVGSSLLARVPLVPSAGDVVIHGLETERRHAQALLEHLPVEVPQLVGVGRPFVGYDGAWSLWTWLEGTSLDVLLDEGRADHDRDALPIDVARLLRAHRSVPVSTASWSGSGRGGSPLADSEWVRRSIERSSHVVDPDASTHVWETALAAPEHVGPPVSVNGDPMPGNLLMRDGRLAGLIDVGEPVVGDPASDLQPAWEIFDEPQRGAFRDAMGLDAAAWERGRGWAFEMAIGGVHYYEQSNPVFFRLARQTLERLVATA
jgi:aminoglycoside phosphotransferase (APT) family kinase protein